MWIDLVSVNFGRTQKNYLFYAPEYSRIVEGDEVICDTAIGPQRGTVVAVTMSSGLDEEKCMFAIKSMGATLPLKRILTVFKRKDLDYLDNEETD